MLKIHINQNISCQLTKEMVYKAFIEYSNDLDDIYKNIEEYSPNKKCKVLILFDNMITDMLSIYKLNPIVTELFMSLKA